MNGCFLGGAWGLALPDSRRACAGGRGEQRAQSDDIRQAQDFTRRVAADAGFGSKAMTYLILTMEEGTSDMRFGRQ